jgi:hypothetical protein
MGASLLAEVSSNDLENFELDIGEGVLSRGGRRNPAAFFYVCCFVSSGVTAEPAFFLVAIPSLASLPGGRGKICTRYSTQKRGPTTQQ